MEELQRIVPVNPRAATEQERGAIQYILKGGAAATAAQGLFSFSYYYRHKPTKANRNVAELTHKKANTYIQGLKAYHELIKDGGPFAGWKLVIYTDTATLEDIEKLGKSDKDWAEELKQLEREHEELMKQMKELPVTEREDLRIKIQRINSERYTLKELVEMADEEESIKREFKSLIESPSCILAICSWPEYSPAGDTKKIDGTILRVFRHKAMMDFPDIPVCIRDADTYFTGDLMGMRRARFVEKLATWEAMLLDRLSASGKRFLVSGVPSYKRGWHVNVDPEFAGTTEQTGEGSGLLAGLVTSLGGIPQWASGQLWNDSIRFIRRRCYVKAESGEISDLYKSTYVGKDEQVIVFIWLPELIGDTFFFYFDFSESSAGGEGGHYATSWIYDKKRYASFEKGVLAVLRESYPDAFHSDGLPRLDAFESPLRKLRRFTRALPELKSDSENERGTLVAPSSNTENDDTSSTKGVSPYEIKEFKGKVEKEFKQLVKSGVIQEDSPIRDFVSINQDDYRLLNPFCVLEAFRNPIYNDIMTLYFKTILDKYTVLCRRRKETREARIILSGEGGGKRRQRLTRRLRGRQH